MGLPVGLSRYHIVLLCVHHQAASAHYYGSGCRVEWLRRMRCAGLRMGWGCLATCLQLSPDQVSSSLFPRFSSVLPLFFPCYLSNKDSCLSLPLQRQTAIFPASRLNDSPREWPFSISTRMKLRRCCRSVPTLKIADRRKDTFPGGQGGNEPLRARAGTSKSAARLRSKVMVKADRHL